MYEALSNGQKCTTTHSYRSSYRSSYKASVSLAVLLFTTNCMGWAHRRQIRSVLICAAAGAANTDFMCYGKLNAVRANNKPGNLAAVCAFHSSCP